MGFLDRLRRVPERPDREDRAADLSGFLSPNSPFVLYSDGIGSSTGVPVTAESAINNTVAVYACVSLLAEVIGSLPLHLYRLGEEGRTLIRPGDGNRGLAGRGYPGSLARLLGEVPNSEMTAQALWETVVGHGALWGCSYVNVVRGANGRPEQLWPLRPDRIESKRDSDGDLFYIYYTDDARTRWKVLLPEEVMRIPWFGINGITGLSPIAVARNAIGIEQSAGRFAGKFYANSATPSSIVTIPRGPQEKFKERSSVYRDHLQALHGGMDNAARIAVVEEGVTWQAVSMPMDDMQFIETRKFQLSEIARLYRIPPHMIGDVEKSTSWGTGIEQQSLGFLTYTLRPILSRIEASVCRDLGLEAGVKTLTDEKLYPEFLTNDLLRTDTKGRYDAYAIAVQNRILSPADVAEIENLPYNPDRPDDYENPNTSTSDTPAPEPADQPMMQLLQDNQRHHEQLILALEGREAPKVETHAAPVNVFNRQLEEGELLSFAEALPQPVIDTKPMAKLMAQAEAHRINEAEKTEERMESLLGAINDNILALGEMLKPPPPRRLVRKVERDEVGNLTRIIDEEEAV